MRANDLINPAAMNNFQGEIQKRGHGGTSKQGLLLVTIEIMSNKLVSSVRESPVRLALV